MMHFVQNFTIFEMPPVNRGRAVALPSPLNPPLTSYTCCPGLSLVILTQFALKVCLAAQNRQKIHKNLYFSDQGHSRSLFSVPIEIPCTTSY